MEQHLVLHCNFGGQLGHFHSNADGVSGLRDLARNVFSSLVAVDVEVEALGVVDEVREAVELVGDMEQFPACGHGGG